MRLTSLLSLSSCLVGAALCSASATLPGYSEHLDLRPLPNHHLHADFTFRSSLDKIAYDELHFRHFPRSLAQVLQQTHTQELHLRFTLGRWDDEEWGTRPRHGAREGGTGVEIWAWITGDSTVEVEQRWDSLVNSLSGQFCASLNFIDRTRTTQPILTFEPEGTLALNGSTHIMHGMLPREVICTENLTPFLKMLPCKGKAGISSLLDGHKLFDASWQSMSIDVRPVCVAGKCSMEVEQAISMALSIPRSMRDRHDPIPRPPRVEDIDCDESKPYNSHDSCFPKAFDGQLAWSLSGVFGRPITGSCALDGQAQTVVSLQVSADREVQTIGHATPREAELVRQYTLSAEQSFDLNLTKQDVPRMTSTETPPLHVSRQLTGYGQQYGGMHTTIQNQLDRPLTVVYLESLPWYIRPYLHSLAVSGGTISKMYYTPLIDRERASQIELLLEIPARGKLSLAYEVEKAVLRYTEYPPDANRGFDIGAAIVRVMPGNDGKTQGHYLRTTPLLLPLPTPDFSMPYNVIILTSTVIALGFGSIFNLLVRRFVLAEEGPPSLAEKIQAGVHRIRGIVRTRLRSAAKDAANNANGSVGKRKVL